MNCENCGAALRPEPGREYFVCEACRSIRQVEPNADGVIVLGTHSEYRCPVCREALVDAAISGEFVLHCAKCRGSLIGTDTFLPVVERLREKWAGAETAARQVEQPELERALDCPRCGRRMDTHPYAGPGNIVIDNCPACSVNWLDYRELRRVAGATDRSPNPDAWEPL
jgi:Zn-finger nucleic acid-binding protein